MDQQYLERIKRTAVIAMFSDDRLMEKLVLKGGNVLDLIHRISTRPSADLDFSIDGDFDDLDGAFAMIQRALVTTFASEQLVAFDIQIRAVPPNLTPDRALFWGGYKVEFKLIERTKHAELKGDIEHIRRAALAVGRARTKTDASTKFAIDLSRREYCAGKETVQFEGYSIFVYSLPMIVCEKIRAVCQQMPEYVAVVGSHARGRARDFVDIHTILEHEKLRFDDAEFQSLVRRSFEAKRVPLHLIGQIDVHREFHRDSFQSVRDTVKPGIQLRDYDFYFDYVVSRCALLKSLGDE
jgi:predicted nucleotidyltransferase component of viral defense system